MQQQPLDQSGYYQMQLEMMYANNQTLVLPMVTMPNNTKLSIENPVTFTGAEAKVDNICEDLTQTSI